MADSWRTNALLRAVLDAAPLLIYAKDLEGRMVIGNGPVTDLIGKPWSQVKGRTDRDFLDDPAQAEAVMATDRRIMRTGLCETVEEHVGKDKQTPSIWLSTKSPLKNAHGKVIGLLGISLDITARKTAERAVQDLNATLKARVEAHRRERDRAWRLSPDPLLVCDFTGVMHAVSPAWTTLLGWAETQLIGRSLMDLLHPDDRGRPLLGVEQGPLSGVAARSDNRCRHLDGSYRWVSWAAVAENDRIYATGRDITLERSREAALMEAEAQLRQLQKMEAVGQLTGGIAHDFNNLLAAITGSLTLVETRIEQGRLDALPRYIQSAQGAARRAATLTQRLLAFSRRQMLDPKPVNLNRLVLDMDDLLRRTLGPTIDTQILGAAGLWACLIDGNQLENALLNLCLNARDAMPQGGQLRIETANHWLDERAARDLSLPSGQYVLLSVADSGTGMPQDVQERAFDPFFTTKPVGEGTGLGLSMVYGFVRQSGGQIRLASALGRGTTVQTYLPRHPMDLVDERDSTTTPPRAGPMGRGETILVIDDEPVVRMLITDVLGEGGYQFIEAENGPAGLQILQSDVPLDLLITDVGLPGGMTGRQVADAARSLRPHLKVLFVTGYAESVVTDEGRMLQGMEVLTKPFDVDALTAKVNLMLH